MRVHFLPILLFSLTSTHALTEIYDIAINGKMSTSGGQEIRIIVDEAVSTSTYQAEVTDPAQLQPSSPYIMPCTYVESQQELHCTTVPGVGRGLQWAVRDVTSGTVATWDSTGPDYLSPEITSLTDVAIPTDGSGKITLSCSNLGPADGKNILYAYFGPSTKQARTNCTFVGTEVSCNTPMGSGTLVPFGIGIAGTSTMRYYINYM